MLDELGQTLRSAAEAGTEQEKRIARRIIDELTGGRIDLFQMGPRKAQQGWLQGRFKVRLLRFLVERITGAVPGGTEQGVEVVIDYRQPPPYEALSEEAKRLYDEDLPMTRIAERLDCDRNTVTAAIRYWHKSRGLPVPDGRTRRKGLARKTSRKAAPSCPTSVDPQPGETSAWQPAGPSLAAEATAGKSTAGRKAVGR